MKLACEVSGDGVMVPERQEDAQMRIWVMFWLVALTTAASAQEIDQGPVQCRDFPFPFNVMCLANRASFIDMKPCPEIGQTSIKPAGQQCDAGRGEGRAFSGFSRGQDCHGRPK